MYPAFHPALPLRPLQSSHPHCLTVSLRPSPPVPPARAHLVPRATISSTNEPATPAEDDPPEYRLAPGEIAVRFINNPTGTDLVAAADPGDGLLTVGDSVGMHIPRACQSGLCGSCTVDVIDPSAENGRQTVRACQTSAIPLDDSLEMVVDLARMRNPRKGPDPMARFENLDTDYVAGASPRISSGRGIVMENVNCPECHATGEIQCYDCDGSGKEIINDRFFACELCAGMKTLRCADCQGTGSIQVRR